MLNIQQPGSETLRFARFAVCIFFGTLLTGCGADLYPAEKTPTYAVMTPEPVLQVTITTPTIENETLVPIQVDELLKNAVANLQSATSFELVGHEIRAYQIIDASGTVKTVYGEFDTLYTVLRLPMLKVHADYKYRYDPQADFAEYESYTYQEDDKYFTQFIEASIANDVEEIDARQLEPMSSDVYQTLVTYFNQAQFVSESDGVAIYTLEHPEWYRLERAIGFADLGFLYGQENGEQLVELYAAEHYPNVETIRFTIYVAVDEQMITRVVIDDQDFMASVWAEVDRGLIESGVTSENLSSYEIMSVNGAEYLFSNYNQIQDFSLP